MCVDEHLLRCMASKLLAMPPASSFATSSSVPVVNAVAATGSQPTSSASAMQIDQPLFSPGIAQVVSCKIMRSCLRDSGLFQAFGSK